MRPAPDGRTIWVSTRLAPSRCTLRRVGLDGRLMRAARAFPCTTRSDPPGGALGLVVRRTRILDPITLGTVFRSRWGILAVVGRSAVLAGPGRGFTLIDTQTGEQRRFAWPSRLGGLDRPAADPSGRYVALAFADPAWGGFQGQDVWVIDSTTGRLRQLPGMPAAVALKRTSMAWTDDGRLVLLGEEAGGRDFVAVWRPEWRRLAVKRLNLPERQGGSDSFAPIR